MLVALLPLLMAAVVLASLSRRCEDSTFVESVMSAPLICSRYRTTPTCFFCAARCIADQPDLFSTVHLAPL